MRLEAGQYALKVLGGRGEGPLAVHVASASGGVTLASAKGILTSSIFDPARDPCLSFKIPPPASNVSITLTNEGSGSIALRAIEVRAEGWSFELPLLLTLGGRRQCTGAGADAPSVSGVQ
jgi:hypothetical protein